MAVRHERKGPCKCGMLARLAADPRDPVEFDPRLNEYHILRQGGGGYTLVYFCPYCGGHAPKSERSKVLKAEALHAKPRLAQQTHEVHMFSAPQPVPPVPQIDTSKRYDVYCLEPGREVVVYLKARFKGAASLLPQAGGRVFHADYVELEQENGQCVFLPRGSIFKFCLPGTALVGEVLGPKKGEPR